MELTDSTGLKPEEQTRSVIVIDLNETPSPNSSESLSPDAFAVVRIFHGNPTPPGGSPARIPGDSHGSSCAACGQPEEVGEHVVVCDGCERGFHLGCTGMGGRLAAVVVEEWMCGECLSKGVRSSRWKLGWKSQALGQKRSRVESLEINASPPIDGQGQESEDFPDSRLPVQYEDFFVLSLGKVDSRPSYHNANQIWPAGYRSCWHDKITGSLFICDVSDGGDSGPVFRVSRRSCSIVPIPNGSTVMFTPNLGQSYFQNRGKNDNLSCVSLDYDEHCSVQMLLSDASPPMESDILSCLGSYSHNPLDGQTSNCLQLEANPLHEGFRNVLSDTKVMTDEIGEFSVEESSSSSAWRMVSKKFIAACRQIYVQTGTLKLFCEHVGYETSLTFLDCTDEKDEGRCSSLARFFGSSCSIKIPSVIKDGVQLETVFKVLEKWLDQDRFGLDVEFVQEIIEELPGVRACSQYVFLKERSYYSSSVTVGNGILLVKTRDGVQGKDIRARTQIVEDPVIESPCPPPGKPFSLKLPVEIIGDVLQVWQFLGRFYEVLGLEAPLSIKELEQELICPWFDGLNLLEKVGGKIQESHVVTSPRTVDLSQHIVPLSTESEYGAAVMKENPRAFIAVPTETMKEATQARMESDTYYRSKGNALIMTYRSLLKVLTGELQSKVAAMVDPKFDTGESKLKRGKKKDMDCSIAKKGTKLNTLPINELTWPELVRRYILAVLSMNANIDPPEIASRDGGKVFRCLQGDGGMLCGSLSGVAGMEADALLLAQAMKKIFGSLNRENDMLCIDDGGSDATSACESIAPNVGNIPEWALLLEPVRKLPTNVGTRIRKCVYNALEKGPPEWAKKMLEHSISKEVYKGNASGPTKKAVLSVLAEVHGEGMPPKPHREKKMKNFMSIADMIMKQCRIVLRQAAAADNEKVFCNLLGRKLMTSSDNDFEGILGSPAMVSRPLDFRTIDLRLAVGAYGGSHEAFLEDIRELWTHMRICYSDKPDLVQLAEKLSSNFEALYEKEVVTLFQKFVGYAKLGCLAAESKKEIDDFLVSSSELPKASWEEGVCKVCGIDKDDVSVLLCDTCDAEYHTYCLNPPLTRIPQGNWYCPSCVTGKHNVQDASERTSMIHCNDKKYDGEYTHVYLDTLAHLASVLEEKEYWEFSVDERTLLLKFLSDELLNSALIRQHLEHCMELSAELQQKLRSVSMEWRNLKAKEEALAVNVAKTEKCPYFRRLEDKSAGNSLNTEPLDAEDRLKDVQAVAEGSQLSGNFAPPMSILEKDKSFRQQEVLPFNILQQETNDFSREDSLQGGMKKYVKRDDSTLPSADDLQGLCLPLHMKSSQIGEHVASTVFKESRANSLELNSVRNEISLLQGSVRSMELQLMKLSARGHFLGCDSAGRLYWVLAKQSRQPWVIVSSREMTLEQQVKVTSGSGVSCPYMHELNDANTSCFPWVSYQSDAEIKGLVEYLRYDDPKERELKESISRWLKKRFVDSEQTENQSQDETQMASSESKNNGYSVYSEFLITKAGSLLEEKYGPWSELQIIDLLKKRGRKAKVTHEDKMFRCSCLESVWPSRYHCVSCHRTFSTDLELEGHNDAMCKLGLPAPQKSKENNALKGNAMFKSESGGEEWSGGMDVFQAKNGYYQFNSKLIKYQNDGLVCPYDFEDICSKFETKRSLKELVQEVGLIGSNGIPMLVPSVSPNLIDPTLMLVPPKEDAVVTCEEPMTDGHIVYTQGITGTTNTGRDNTSLRRRATNDLTVAFKSDKSIFRCSEQKDQNMSCHSYAPAVEVGNCCVIPESALRPLIGKASLILRRLKIDLLDMDAALPEAALRPSKAHLERRWAWRAFVKSADTIHEMVQAEIVFEDMIKTEYLKKMWWYWSSLSAAAKICTLSALALRIYSLDASIEYEKDSSNSDKCKLSGKPDQKPESVSDGTDKLKLGRKQLKRKRD